MMTIGLYIKDRLGLRQFGVSGSESVQACDISNVVYIYTASHFATMYWIKVRMYI